MTKRTGPGNGTPASARDVKVIPLPARPDRVAGPKGPASDAAGSGRAAADEAATAAAEPEAVQREDSTPVPVRSRRHVRRKSAAASVIAHSLDAAQRQQRELLGMLERSARPKPPPAREEADGVFWPVWLEHRSYLRGHALRFSGGNMADAEDALSEAMLKAVQNFSPAKIRNHRSWLLRLVHNACMDRHRGNSRRQRVARELRAAGRRAAPRPDALPRSRRRRGRPGPGGCEPRRGRTMSAAVPRPAGPFVGAGSVRIFDTTLRDGEQAPGAGLTAVEKLEVARQLVRLKVDVIEAGFPAASPGDFEAVRRIAQEARGVAVAALARCRDGDPQRAIEAIREASPRSCRPITQKSVPMPGVYVSVVRLA